MIVFHKYQGAGNDFLIADNRCGAISSHDGVLEWTQDGKTCSLSISRICDRRYGVGADGLMLLESSQDYDFKMVYFNSDGSGGMMCGNGGRCIVAFAADCGIRSFRFEAADGEHRAEILQGLPDSDGKVPEPSRDPVKTVRLKMKDVCQWTHYESLSGASVPSDGYFLDTGTRHFVRMVSSLGTYPVVEHGRDIRYNGTQLQPVGANVNFVEPFPGGISVRTYEKGVEDETFACGTGIVASCLAVYIASKGDEDKGVSINPQAGADGRVRFDVRALRDELSVDFLPSDDGMCFSDIWLTGPATFVADVLVRP